MRKLSFATLVLLMVAMGAATFFEKQHGTPQALTYFYHSHWFIGLWVFAVFAALCSFWYKRVAMHVLSIHLSLVMILLGAVVSHLTSTEGFINLRKGRPVSAYTTVQKESKDVVPLGFSVVLDSFKVTNYPGTSTAADYTSYVSINEPRRAGSKLAISMNRIGSYNGFRFCQSSFDDDRSGSTLSVSHDLWGTAITFAGYAALALSMLWILLAREGRFRNLLRNPLLKTSVFVLLLWNGATADAQTLTADNKTLSGEMAEKLGRTWLLYNNRIAPLHTLASDFTVKLTGKRSWNGYSECQFLAGWFFFPEQWYREPVIKIQSRPELQNLLGVKGSYAAFADFFTIDGKYKLLPWMDKLQTASAAPMVKAVSNAHEKVSLIKMLSNGSLVRLLPVNSPAGVEWIGAGEQIPTGVNSADSAFVHNILSLYYRYVCGNKADSSQWALARIAGYQRAITMGNLPTTTHKNLEIFYNRVQVFKISFMVALTLGIVGIAWVMMLLFTETNTRWYKRTISGFLIVMFVVVGLALALRTYISGHAPLGNGYEIMLCTAWASLGIGLWFRSRSLFVPSFSLFLSGVVLLTAHLGLNNPQITPLAPVLNSYWLNIHVSFMMLAYAFAGFMAIIGLVVLVLHSISPRKMQHELQQQVERLTIISRVMLYLCVFLMGAGVFLGAVWANISWGRYWGWDPKETWALISFLTYAMLLHLGTFKFLAKPLIYHSGAFLALSSVLMTFIGVNYFLGGMHSYAGGESTAGIVWLALGGCVSMITVGFALYRNRTINQ